MSRLTSKPPSELEIMGARYAINDHYVNALLTWDAFQAAADGEISGYAAAVVATDNMFRAPLPPICDETVKAIAAYLEAYSRTGKGDGKDSHPPLLSIEQDGQMIYDAILAAGVDLDSERVTYPRFMSLLREIPKDCQLCRVIYLRQQHRANKLTKEERMECYRRGWDVIKLRSRKQQRDAEDNRAHFKKKQDELRAAMGLPPL